MITMYDRLGDLISQALEEGKIPEYRKKNNQEEDFERKDCDKEENDEGEKAPDLNQKHKKTVKHEKVRIIPQNVKNAMNIIGIPEESSFSQAKKIYREKISYFHPDKWSKDDANPVLLKIAREKTEKILESWKEIESYFG